MAESAGLSATTACDPIPLNSPTPAMTARGQDDSGGAQQGRRSGSGRGRTAGQILTEARQLILPVHQAVVAGLDEPLREVAEYQAGWRETDGTPCSRTGKAIRPALVLACARAAAPVPGTTSVPGPSRATAAETCGHSDAMMAAGVAVELVHEFSLLHDDVMDQDTVRRHRPTAWVVFGVDRAVLAGDALLVLATDLLATSLRFSESTAAGTGEGASVVEALPLRVLARALMELCRGQSADLTFEGRDQVSLRECVAMAEGKTGALLGAACQLGALAGGADQVTAQAYRVFGRQLGVAFQLVDDLLGIWGDPAVTGKPVGADDLQALAALMTHRNH